MSGRLKMNDQPKKEQYSGMRDQEIRAALDQHGAASDANDFETEHRIYHDDAVLEYPQSGARTRGRRNSTSGSTRTVPMISAFWATRRSRTLLSGRIPRFLATPSAPVCLTTTA